MPAAQRPFPAEILCAAGISNLVQDQSLLRSALPGRFDAALLPFLDRLESSALFSGEGCSFSHSELPGSLPLWTEKAQVQLDTRRISLIICYAIKSIINTSLLGYGLIVYIHFIAASALCPMLRSTHAQNHPLHPPVAA